MSLNMNNTFLFMNWVLDRLDNSDSNDFQAFVLYMRNSLTPQLWEDFMKSDSALSLTQSFVDSVKQKVVPKPKKSRAKKAESTLEESNTLSNQEDGVLREPEPVAPKPKKSRAKKVETNTLSNEGVVPVKNTKKSGSRVLKKSKEELSEVVGLNEEEEYQEIQLQLVNVGGRDAFIDSQNNVVF